MRYVTKPRSLARPPCCEEAGRAQRSASAGQAEFHQKTRKRVDHALLQLQDKGCRVALAHTDTELLDSISKSISWSLGAPPGSRRASENSRKALVDIRHDRIEGQRRRAVAGARMRLEGIKAGHIVEVDRLGRRFHAIVTGSGPGGLELQPIDRRVNYFSCRSREVTAHWAKRGCSAAKRSPRASSTGQLEIHLSHSEQG